MTTHSPSVLRGGGRTFGSGPRARVALIALVAIVAAAVLAVALIGSAGSAPVNATVRADRIVSQDAQPVQYTNHPVKTSGKTYGVVPAWLGRKEVPVSRVVTATPSAPKLAVQGDTVDVQLAHAGVLATVAGPAVPEEGHFPIPRTSPCTFTVTFAAATAAIPLSARQFATIDEEGALHTLRITTLDGSAMPSQIPAGRTLTLKLSAVLPVGQGRVLWAPVAGLRPTVQWDFDVEID